jgi:hypothetical protein
VQSGATLSGLALSPDNKTLYVSNNCLGCNPPGQADCPPLNGICIFDTGTWSLKGQMNELSGALKMSRDGQSLYVLVTIEGPKDKAGGRVRAEYKFARDFRAADPERGRDSR